MVELLSFLSDVNNFTWTPLTSVEWTFGTCDNDDGRWSGVIGMVSNGSLDIAISELSVTKERPVGGGGIFRLHLP
jgi:hypothetical protein